jgi:ligand-binding sensor domain-containing protein
MNKFIHKGKTQMKYIILFCALLLFVIGCKDSEPTSLAPAQTSQLPSIEWEATNGPYSGWVESIAIDPSGIIFVGTTSYGVYSTSNGGTSWQNIGLGDRGISCIARSAQGTLFAGSSGNGGLYRSTDIGASWSFFSAIAVRKIICDTGNTIYVACGTGVLRSTDDGQNWTQVNAGLYSTSVQTIALSPNHDLFLAIESGGAYKSTNKGDSWNSISFGSLSSTITSFLFDTQGNIFAGTWGFGLNISTNNGTTWSQSTITTDYVYIHALALGTSGEIYASIEYQKNGQLTPAVYRINSNGTNWTNVLETRTPMYGLAVGGTGSIYAGTRGDGLFCSSNDGSSWQLIGVPFSNIRSMAVSSTGRIFASTTSSFYSSDDGGIHWALRYQYPSYDAASGIITSDGNGYVFCSMWGKVARSTDNGVSWSPLTVDIVNKSINSFLITKNGTILTSIESPGILRSTDKGDNWTYISNNSIQFYSLASTSAGQIFAGSYGNVYKSINDGVSWNLTSSILTQTSISSMAIDIRGNIFAGTDGNGIWCSTDNGANWHSSNSGLPDIHVRMLATDKQGHVFAGTYTYGNFCSVDQGKSWHELNFGLGDKWVRAFCAGDDGYIYIGTEHLGVFRSKQPINN